MKNPGRYPSSIKLIVSAVGLTSQLASAQLDMDSAQVITLPMLFEGKPGLIASFFPDLGEQDQLDADFGFSMTAACRSLVIGAPRLTISGKKAGGVFQVLASDSGLDLSTANLFYQGVADQYGKTLVYGKPESGDLFGYSLAAANPKNRMSEEMTCPLFGRPYTNYSDLSDAEQKSVDAGGTLVFVGAPREDMSNDENTGMVNILGVHDENSSSWSYIHRGRAGVLGTRKDNDWFGFAVASGDFNGDGGFDLAIGAPYDDNGRYDNTGGVNSIMMDVAVGWDFKGGKFKAFNNEIWSQENLAGQRRDNEEFGRALVVGDFNDDGNDDLAVGVPFDEYLGKGTTKKDNRTAGAVNIIYGKGFKDTMIREGGLRILGNERLDQATEGISGGPEDGDEFGRVLAVGDFNNDGADDLAVGAPGEAIGDEKNAGMVHVLYGNADATSAGTVTAGFKRPPLNSNLGSQDRVVEDGFHQNTKGITGTAESGDRFGAALAAADLNGDGYDDLIIGVPGEDLSKNTVENAGGVAILYGSPDGITAEGDKWIDEGDIPGLGGLREWSRFGSTLATGHFDADNKADLAITARGAVEREVKVWGASSARTIGKDVPARIIVLHRN